MDIRLMTCVIIRKDKEYLVGKVLYSEDLRWSRSPHDAWRTRNIKKARDMAQNTGGTLMLFNPVAGQLRAL